MILSQRATEAEAKTFFAELNAKHKENGFNLSKACFPVLSEERLEEGYKTKKCAACRRINIPYLVISASSEKIFGLFMDLLRLFKKPVNVSLESDHHCGIGTTYWYCSRIDPIVLRSVLWEFEDFLTDSGYDGIAASNRKKSIIVLFDSHKHLVIYNWILLKKRILAILEENGIQRNQNLRTLIEMPHCHSSSKYFQGRFNELKSLLQKMSP